MIMGYDYYYNGSSMAGPIDPHYSMTYNYNYSVSRTLSYYQSEGMPLDKMLIGIPYYARDWPTASGTAPSTTTAYGTALTWANVRNNSSGKYSTENKHFEPNSMGTYYAYEDNGWRQCFANDENVYRRRYKMVNQRGLAGIGIWALGYDNGYSELWDLIRENFTNGPRLTIKDTVYDSGGPAWNYYDDEDYTLSFHGPENEMLQLEFSAFSLETGYDSLWVYDSLYPGGTLLGGYTGSSLPETLLSSNIISIRFKSDHNTREAGWRAVVSTTLTSTNDLSPIINALNVYPNPASDHLNIILPEYGSSNIISLYDISGKKVFERKASPGKLKTSIDVSSLSPGIYVLSYSSRQNPIAQQKVIIK